MALGAAAAAIEPIASTSLQLVHSGIARLIDLFPHEPADPVASAEYNRLTAEEHERLRDFVVLRYKANGRRGEPLWDRCREMTVPQPLARKLAVYESRGRVPLEDGETFEEPEWAIAFDELGVRPRRHHPRAGDVPAEQIERHLQRLRQVMIGAVAKLPSHGDYLRRHAAAPPQDRSE